MKRLSATVLALGLFAALGTASAQTYGGYNTYGNSTGTRTVVPDRYGNTGNAIYDYARVLRVDPVIDTRYGNNNTYRTGNNTYSNNGYTNQSGQRCYNSASRGGYTTDRYGNRVANDPYYPQNGRYGTNTGRTVATVIGGIAGAVLGSKVGGGSGTYAATAIGSMVGGLAGRQVYESTQRRKYEGNAVEVCDPVDDGYYGNNNGNNSYGNNSYGNNSYGNNGYGNNGYYGSNVANNDGRVVGYDVTYEYMGRQFVTRTDYHPGDRIRVRVDVRPE
jgi:uncharacterized protein YcfJ